MQDTSTTACSNCSVPSRILVPNSSLLTIWFGSHANLNIYFVQPWRCHGMTSDLSLFHVYFKS